jgi:hypothetical protein
VKGEGTENARYAYSQTALDRMTSATAHGWGKSSCHAKCSDRRFGKVTGFEPHTFRATLSPLYVQIQPAHAKNPTPYNFKQVHVVRIRRWFDLELDAADRV